MLLMQTPIQTPKVEVLSIGLKEDITALLKILNLSITPFNHQLKQMVGLFYGINVIMH